MRRNAHAIIPVKSLSLSKSRLSGGLAPNERRDLSISMLRNVLGAVAGARGVAGATIVSKDPSIWQITREFGFDILADVPENGPTDAITLAADQCGFAPGILALMADLPLITSADVDRVLQASDPGPAVTLVPSHDGRGTNAAFWSPTGQFRFVFNGRGLARNIAIAVEAKVTPTLLRLPRVALDLDTAEDLALTSAGCPDPAIVAALSGWNQRTTEVGQK